MTDFKDWLDIQETIALKGNYKSSPFIKLVAAAYKLAPIVDQRTIPLYKQLAEKVAKQQKMLSSKYTFVPDAGDHYSSLKQLRASMNQQRAAGNKKPTMYVYAEPPGPEGHPAQQGHPTLTNDQNVMLRGVHDAIAHLAGNHPFSARGEFAAYNRHLKTLCNTEDAKAGRCDLAKILFTEIVGQTSYYYAYGGFGPQKAVILEDFDHYYVGRLAPTSPLNNFFVLQGKELVQRPDFNAEAFAQLPIGAEVMKQR